MRALLLTFLASFLFIACKEAPKQEGYGVITFELDDSTQVVLETGSLEFEKPITIKNSTENIILRPVSNGLFSVPVFSGSISGVWNAKNTAFVGQWTDSLRPGNYTVPVKIIATDGPLNTPCSDEAELMEWNTTEGRLVANVSCGTATATFLTPTGDYRYLSGYINSKGIQLVTFDGAHLFHISADIEGDSLVNGVFKSGTHYTGKWSGVRAHEPLEKHKPTQEHNNEHAFRISGINPEGDTVVYDMYSLWDSGKRGLVVDILGTWCPNCYDEVNLLSTLREENPDVEFVSLAFERRDLDHSLSRIATFKKEMGVDWPVLYGGKASKSVADSAVPFLGGVKSFPTTAFISSSGEITVHTGFNGPATGRLHEEEIKFFKEAIKSL